MSGIALALFVGAGSMGVTASPPALITGAGSGSSFTTPAVSAIVSGGAGAPVYAWSIIADDGLHGFSVTSPAGSSTTIGITGITAGDICTATLRCSVTDGGSALVDVEITHTDSRPAP